MNGFHGSDSVESAEREIALWFKPEEVHSFEGVSESWLYENPPKKVQKTRTVTTTVPNLDLEKVTPAAPNSQSERSLRTVGLIGAAAVGIAVAAGVLIAKKRD